MPEMSEEQDNCAATVHENTIFVFGGIDEVILLSVKYFDTMINKGRS